MSTEIQISKKIAVLEEGALITPNVNQIDFVGNGVNASTVGDNVTVNIPGSTGSTTYYMNQSVNQAPYKEFSSVATLGVEQVVPATVLAGATSIIAEYQTPSGVPGTSQIPTGLWQFFLHFDAGTAGQNWIIRPSVYSRDLGGIETLLLVLDPVVVTNMPTVTTMYISDAVFPATTVLTTDRIVVKIAMENTTGVSQTVNFRTEGTQHYSVGLTTLNQVIPAAGVTAVTGTSPVVSSGGTTPAISMPQATASVNGYLAASDWTVFNAKQNAITLTTTGSSGASTLVGATLNIPNYAGGAAGVWGISNSLGVYTYYTTLTLAMAAATSGQVIEMFADVVETGNVTITLKDGVNIQGNGHSYTLNTTTATNAFVAITTEVKMTFSNITLIKSGTGAGIVIGSGVATNHFTGISCTIKVISPNSFGISVLTNPYTGYLTGFSVIATGSASNGINCTRGTMDNCFAISTSGYGISSNISNTSNCYGESLGSGTGVDGANGSGYLTSCFGKSNTGVGLNTSVTTTGCTGVSSGNAGLYAISSCLVTGCTGVSSSSKGIFAAGGIINSSSGYSAAEWGIFIQGGRANNSYGYSAANTGLQIYTSGSANNCIFETLSGSICVGLANSAAGSINNCTIINYWNNASGHCLEANAAMPVSNCVFQVANASAKAIYSASALTLKYANNTFKGSTAPISTTITQGIVNTFDNQGNILI